MNRSTDRILTTHAGSLVRTRDIVEGMKARTLGKAYDQEKLANDIRRGVAEVVRKQVEVGIDIPSDGEYARRGFTSYMHERLSGLESRSADPGELAVGHGAEREDFPGFFEQYDKVYRSLWMYPDVSLQEVADMPGNTEFFRLSGPLTYVGQEAVRRDIEVFRAALRGLDVADAFITAVTPVSRKGDKDVLQFYSSHEAYLYALADAMREEYRTIVDAGFILQLDYAALNPLSQILKDTKPSGDEMARVRELGVELVNHALDGIPVERVRYHHCWGSHNRPHTRDAPLRDFVHTMLKLRVQAYGVEAANPRHEHEWMLWKDVKLPDGKILIPGIISQSTNVVEHPELVAWRIQNFASVVGKENVIAGTDCGFSQYWDQIRVHPTVQWAKLKALADGAALASEQLWGRTGTHVDLSARRAESIGVGA